MTKWLECRKKIEHFSAFVNWRQQQEDLHSLSQNPIGPPHACALTVKMVQNPSKACVLFNVLARDYGALADFIAQVNHPGVLNRTKDISV
jgi:hypothetical protein